MRIWAYASAAPPKLSEGQDEATDEKNGRRQQEQAARRRGTWDSVDANEGHKGQDNTDPPYAFVW